MNTQLPLLQVAGTAKPSRRRFLALGIGSAVVLAAAGGVALGVRPALSQGKLQVAGREIFAAVLPAVLGGIWPKNGDDGAALGRIDTLVAGLPAHAQAELGQLLSLLGTAVGRRGLAGLVPNWAAASPDEVRTALQGMRSSGLALKRQAYFALHDIAASAYFSESATWASMGYPGPTKIA